jgi:hypothetical protein
MDAGKDKPPGILETAGVAWSVLMEAVETMPSVFVAGVFALLAVKLVLAAAKTVLLDAIGNAVLGALANLLIAIPGLFAESLVFAAIAISIHRLVLLNETKDDGIALFAARTVRFALWATAVQLGWFAIAILWVVPLFLSAPGSPLPSLIGVVSLVLYGIQLFVAVRLSLVFPAIAADHAAGPVRDVARWIWSIARGHWWRLALSGLFAVLPLAVGFGIVALVIMAVLRGHDVAPADVAFWVGTIVQAIAEPFGIALAAAALSWIYRFAMVAPGREE